MLLKGLWKSVHELNRAWSRYLELDQAANLNFSYISNKLRQIAGSATAYFVSDHLGSIRGLANANGSLTSTVTYDSYGNVVAGSLPTRYTFTGRETDNDTGLMYYRARWYDPRQGRFISEDPIGFGGGVNFYNYVRSSPVRFIDPFGLCPEDNIGPCAWEEERDMKEAAKAFKGDFNAPPYDWKFKVPPGTTNDDIIDALKNNGFEEFWNPFHFGTDLQKNINGRWSHLTVNNGEITEHYEISKPNSLAHKFNFTEPWKRPSDEECLRRQMGDVGGGEIPQAKPKSKPKPRPRPRQRPKSNDSRKP